MFILFILHCPIYVYIGRVLSTSLFYHAFFFILFLLENDLFDWLKRPVGYSIRRIPFDQYERIFSFCGVQENRFRCTPQFPAVYRAASRVLHCKENRSRERTKYEYRLLQLNKKGLINPFPSHSMSDFVLISERGGMKCQFLTNSFYICNQTYNYIV